MKKIINYLKSLLISEREYYLKYIEAIKKNAANEHEIDHLKATIKDNDLKMIYYKNQIVEKNNLIKQKGDLIINLTNKNNFLKNDYENRLKTCKENYEKLKLGNEHTINGLKNRISGFDRKYPIRVGSKV
jgi:hypothetical protein